MRLEVTGKIQKAEMQKKGQRTQEQTEENTEKRARGSEPDWRDRAGTAQGACAHRRCWEGRQGRCMNS